MQRHLITIACLLAALGLYAVGSKAGAVFLVLGAACEVAFWVRLARARRQP
jgi:hypothetical protein